MTPSETMQIRQCSVRSLWRRVIVIRWRVQTSYKRICDRVGDGALKDSLPVCQCKVTHSETTSVSCFEQGRAHYPRYRLMVRMLLEYRYCPASVKNVASRW